ncbi:hypothetical protein K3495_g11314 [Podosphaera aphanis]|nr:hypothetical protein K3495_g11314 [Podosphaera aphanis]
MTKLSSEQVTSITTLLNNGKSKREVVKIVGCGGPTAEDYVKGQGSHRALDVNGGVKTAVEMAMLINTEREDKIPPVTIRRALKEEGLKAFKKKKTPFLSKGHRRARLKWALNHQNWAIEDWKRVLQIYSK